MRLATASPSPFVLPILLPTFDLRPIPAQPFVLTLSSCARSVTRLDFPAYTVDMRILLLSDIHANRRGAWRRSSEEFDVCLFLGDLVDYGVDPGPCIDWVRQNAQYAVRGQPRPRRRPAGLRSRRGRLPLPDRRHPADHHRTDLDARPSVSGRLADDAHADA